MKLQSLSIRDFRGIESLDLDFTDELGLIRDRIPIVGPNTSGKTSVLDAIALCLMPVTEMYRLREGLRLSPPALVRSGADRAHVIDRLVQQRRDWGDHECPGTIGIPSTPTVCRSK